MGETHQVQSDTNYIAITGKSGIHSAPFIRHLELYTHKNTRPLHMPAHRHTSIHKHIHIYDRAHSHIANSMVAAAVFTPLGCQLCDFKDINTHTYSNHTHARTSHARTYITYITHTNDSLVRQKADAGINVHKIRKMSVCFPSTGLGSLEGSQGEALHREYFYMISP